MKKMAIYLCVFLVMALFLNVTAKAEVKYLSSDDIKTGRAFLFLSSNVVYTTSIISFALPTLRWGEPAYTQFTYSAFKEPTGYMVEPPYYWWAINAKNGYLMIATSFSLFPFTDKGILTKSEIIPPQPWTVKEQDAKIEKIINLIKLLAPDFFNTSEGDSVKRKDLLVALNEYFSSPVLMSLYRGISPDFFVWLER